MDGNVCQGFPVSYVFLINIFFSAIVDKFLRIFFVFNILDIRSYTIYT